MCATQPRAVHDRGVLGDGRRQRPLRVEAAAPVRPLVERRVDDAERVARAEVRAERDVVRRERRSSRPSLPTAWHDAHDTLPASPTFRGRRSCRRRRRRAHRSSSCRRTASGRAARRPRCSANAFVVSAGTAGSGESFATRPARPRSAARRVRIAIGASSPTAASSSASLEVVPARRHHDQHQQLRFAWRAAVASASASRHGMRIACGRQFLPSQARRCRLECCRAGQ